MYLLDTNIVIYALKAQPSVVAEIGKHDKDPMALCVVTLMELRYGAHKSRHVEANLARLRALEEAFEIIPLSAACADVFGGLKARLEAAGRPLDDFDLALAATALAYGHVLVTNNHKHFARIPGLKIENWAA